MLAEIYRRAGAWKVRNVSAGWDRGLEDLVTEHGVEVDDAATAPVAFPSPAPRSAGPAPRLPSPRPADTSPVILTKAQPTVSLAKRGDSGIMRINLNWTQGRRKMFGGGAIDLDLACLFQLRDGRKGVVQALGNSFGSLEAAPYIVLDGDDRSGGVAAGENLLVNLAHLEDFTRILVFAYIYQGAPNWSAADGVVTLYPPTGTPVEVRLDSPDNRARSCVIALLKHDKGSLTVTREVKYVHGTQDAVSKAYRWGLKWTAGRK